MNIYAENKSQSLTNVVSLKQSNDKTATQLIDNRPEAIVQRKLQEIANNSPQVNQLKSFQKTMNNTIAINGTGGQEEAIVQKKPEINKSSPNYIDPDYPGMILTLNQAMTDDFGENVYDVTGTENNVTVTYDNRKYYNVDGNEIWTPLFSTEIGEERDHYKTFDEDAIVDITSLEYENMGSITEDKMKTLRSGIKNSPIPPIDVKFEDGRYVVMNGRNRIECSIENGYTKIPIKIVQ